MQPWEAVNMHQRRVLTETHGENCLKGQSSVMHHGLKLNSTDPRYEVSSIEVKGAVCDS